MHERLRRRGLEDHHYSRDRRQVHGEFRGVGWASHKSLARKLHDRYLAHTMEMETTALPSIGFARPRTPTPPPSISELEMQRACFSTAKVPWLSAKKLPKDGNIEVLVKAIVNAIQEEVNEPLKELHKAHDFPMVFNPERERHNYAGMYGCPKEAREQKLRRRVLRVLEQNPICGIGELLACDPDTWAKISKGLGGLTHGCVVRNAMHLIHSNQVRQVDRAVCQAALCQRQRIVDRGIVSLV